MNRVNHEDFAPYELLKGRAVTTEDKAIADEAKARAMASDDQTIRDALRILSQRMRTQGVPLHNPQAAFDYLALRIAQEPREVFGALWLDSSGHLIDCEVMFVGTLATCQVYPREVLKSALDRGARSVVLFHNHPSGDTRPSVEDIVMTRRLIDILKVVDVGVQDHIIVGGALCAMTPGRLCRSLRSNQEYWFWINEVDHSNPRELADIERLVRRGV